MLLVMASWLHTPTPTVVHLGPLAQVPYHHSDFFIYVVHCVNAHFLRTFVQTGDEDSWAALMLEWVALLVSAAMLYFTLRLVRLNCIQVSRPTNWQQLHALVSAA